MGIFTKRIDKLESDVVNAVTAQNNSIRNIIGAIDNIDKRIKLQQEMILSLNRQIELIVSAITPNTKPKIYKKSDE